MNYNIWKAFFAITIFCWLCTSANLNAQDYHTGIGVRLAGVTPGITVKHFMSDQSALEGILSFASHSFFITGLYERQQPVDGADGLGWFYGGGVHLGAYDHGYDYFYYKYHGKKYYYTDYRSETAVGADFILGLEYKFNKAPVTLGLDVKPFFDFSPGFYGYWDGALTFRFTL